MCVWPGTGERCPEGPHILRRVSIIMQCLRKAVQAMDTESMLPVQKNLYGPYEESPYNPVLRQFNPDAPIQREQDMAI